MALFGRIKDGTDMDPLMMQAESSDLLKRIEIGLDSIIAR